MFVIIQRCGNTKGLTLLELLIGLSISSLIIAVSIPSFTQSIESNRADTLIRKIQGHLSSARTTAITQGRQTTVCGSQDAIQCNRSNIRYLLVFIDKNRDRKIDTSERVAGAVDLFLEDRQLTLRASLGRPYIVYNATGTVRQAGSFIYCPKSGDIRAARRLTINLAGRSFIAKDNDGDGVVEARRGGQISCLS